MDFDPRFVLTNYVYTFYIYSQICANSLDETYKEGKFTLVCMFHYIIGFNILTGI